MFRMQPKSIKTDKMAVQHGDAIETQSFYLLNFRQKVPP